MGEMLPERSAKIKRKPRMLHQAADVKLHFAFERPLLDDPDAVLKTYQLTELALRTKHKRRIHVDHSTCKRMDLAASILLDTLVVAAEKRRKPWWHF